MSSTSQPVIDNPIDYIYYQISISKEEDNTEDKLNKETKDEEPISN